MIPIKNWFFENLTKNISIYFKNIITISFLASGNLLAFIISGIISMIQARFVIPEDLGYFNSFAIISGYIFIVNLGLHSSVQLLYPYHIGKNNYESALDVVEVTQVWNVILSIIIFGAFSVFSLFSIFSKNWMAALAWLSQAFVALNLIYGTYLNVTFRTNSDFHILAKSTFIGSAFTIIIVPIYFIQPFVALALRNIVSNLIPLIYLHHKRPLRPKWSFSWQRWVKYNKIGLPIFFASYLSGSLWIVIQSSLILIFLGNRQLGLWSISLIILAAANTIPSAITSVFIPKVIQEYGSSENINSIKKIIAKPIIYGSIIIVIIILIAKLSLSSVIPIIIPNYSEAVPIMNLILIDLFVTLFDLPYALLLAMGRIKYRNIAVIAGLLLFIILSIVFLQNGLGLIGIVLSSFLGKSLKVILTNLFIFKF